MGTRVDHTLEYHGRVQITALFPAPIPGIDPRRTPGTVGRKPAPILEAYPGAILTKERRGIQSEAINAP